MIRAAQSVYFTALGLWVGGLAALGSIVAPTVFQKVASRQEAGRIFGAVLDRFGVVELVLAALLLVSSWVLRSAPNKSLGRLRTVLVVLMCLLATISVLGVNPAVARAAAKVPDIEKAPENDPGRLAFRSLHRWSERLAGGTLVVGIALLALSGASFKPPSDGA